MLPLFITKVSEVTTLYARLLLLSQKCISEKGTKLKYILGDFCFLKPEEFCTILYTFVNSYNDMYFVQILVVNP